MLAIDGCKLSSNISKEWSVKKSKINEFTFVNFLLKKIHKDEFYKISTLRLLFTGFISIGYFFKTKEFYRPHYMWGYQSRYRHYEKSVPGTIADTLDKRSIYKMIFL